jgi:hypothetical protein
MTLCVKAAGCDQSCDSAVARPVTNDAPPRDALHPKTMAPWVADITERMQCSPDFVGVPAVVAPGSVIGRRVGIRPRRRTEQRRPRCLRN